MTLPRNLSKIPVPLYGGILLFATDRKVFERGYKYLHDCEYPDNTEDAAGLTMREHVCRDGYIYYLCGIFDGQEDTRLHETIHASVVILKRAGINPHDDDGESHCYLSEFLYNAFKKKMQPKVKKVIAEHVDGREW